MCSCTFSSSCHVVVGDISCNQLELLMPNMDANIAARMVYAHNTLSSRSRDGPTESTEVSGQVETEIRPHSTKGARQSPVNNITELSASKNNPEPQLHVPRISEYPINGKFPRSAFPF